MSNPLQSSRFSKVLLALLIIPIMVFHRYQSREMESRLT